MSFLTTLTSYLFRSPHPTTPSPPSDASTSTFLLPSSRTLTFATFGSPTGPTILYQHGFPGSRLEAAHFDSLARDLGLRVIAIDRPGHGGSSPHPGAGLKEWAKDVEAVVDGLRIGRVGVLVSPDSRNEDIWGRREAN
jgi:alpha-beta hydrolase superfamily lysophospholipase